MLFQKTNSNSIVIDYFFQFSDAQTQNDLVSMTNIFADYKIILITQQVIFIPFFMQHGKL